MNQDYSHLYGAPPSDPPQPETPPKPFVLNSSDEEPLPPPQPFSMHMADAEIHPSAPFLKPVFTPPPQSVRPAPAPKPVRVRQPFSPTSFLLIAGVVFLFLGGAIFLTQTWKTLPDTARAIVLLSLSLLFFGANVIAEKVFRLPKTGLAFYILGCIFLPMSVAGIGVFKLLGEWFSFAGDGSSLVAAVTAVCVAVTTGIGVRSYKHPFLAWLSLAASACTAFFLDDFAMKMANPSAETSKNLFCLIFVLFTASSLALTEWLIRCKPDTLYGKTALWYQYPLMLFTAGMLFLLALGAENTTVFVALILALVHGVCFFYPRFELKTKHIGIFGAVFCMITASTSLTKLSAFSECHDYAKVVFAATVPAFLCLAFFCIPKISDVLRRTAIVLGWVLCIPMAAFCGVGSFFFAHTFYQFELYTLAALGILFFAVTKKSLLPGEKWLSAATAGMVYLTTLHGTYDDNSYLAMLMLVIEALLLVVQALLSRKLWYFVEAGAAAAGMIALNMKDPFLWMLWIMTGIALFGVIYSHITRRSLLEKTFAWCTIIALIPALTYTLYELAHLSVALTSILVLTAVTLLYLLEIAVFPKHERVSGTGLFLEVVGILLSIITSIACLSDSKMEPGLLLLVVILLGVFAATLTAKRINLAAIPNLLLLVCVASRLFSQFSERMREGFSDSMDPEILTKLIQVGCYVLLLAALAVMGRVMLPKFIEKGEKMFRMDLPLLAGILVIILTVVTIDWYPLMLFCLFMCLYALAFLGRVENRYVPAILASLFGCLTLLCHSIYDPFLLLEKLSILDIKTLPIMLYLLPAHIFILTLLFILPEKFRNGVHMARFVMYCVTMVTLLCASLYFKNVTDAIVLVVFSFLILVGSFVSKKLRWFTLGFAVMVVMTIRLTWSFWTSLHWGIYLFLAGILLIVIASLYEYSARYAREHPDEPKKKFTLFAAWKW